MPDTIQFANGNQIVHVYDAEGNRLQTTYYTRRVATVVPALSTLPSTDNLQEYAIVSQANVGNKRYKRSGHGAWQLDYVFNPEGYTRYYGQEEHYRFYYIKDYLGNVREVYVNPEPGYKECVQRTQYYPSGLPWNEGFVPIEQPFKYNGKEFVEMHGLDEYDSEARWYYPAIMRTTTMDPLCEKYYSTSPYAWCGNNLVNLVDQDGMAAYYTNTGEYLGVDQDGFTGLVYITTPELYGDYKEMTDVTAGSEVTPLQDANLTAEAYSAIYTHILGQGHFPIKRLLNEAVSVGNTQDGSEYNHPNKDKYQPQTLAASSVAAKVIRLTVNQKSDIISLLNTVENIQNALGVHELKSHGIQGVNRENHYLAYQNQITHYTWSKTTAAFKEHFYKAYLTYAAAAKQTHTQLYKKVYNLIHPHK